MSQTYSVPLPVIYIFMLLHNQEQCGCFHLIQGRTLFFNWILAKILKTRVNNQFINLARFHQTNNFQLMFWILLSNNIGVSSNFDSNIKFEITNLIKKSQSVSKARCSGRSIRLLIIAYSSKNHKKYVKYIKPYNYSD